MSKAKTLAGTVSTGGPLADGVIGIPEVTGLQDALDAKQATLVSGTNIKTVSGQSLLGSGDLQAGISSARAWGMAAIFGG